MTGIAFFVWILCSVHSLWALQTSLSATTSTDPQITISGRVVNGVTGLPVSRALVVAGSLAMLTDHEGRFRFAGTSEIISNIQVTKPGFALSPEQLDVPVLSLAAFPDKSAIEATLYPEAILTGTVTAPDGSALPHVGISIRRSLFSESGHYVTIANRTQTDSHGNFRSPVPAGDYILQVDYTRLPYDLNQVVLPASVPPSSSEDLAGLHVHSGEELHVDLFPAVSHTHTITFASAALRDGPPPRITARSASGLVLPAGSGRNQNRGGGGISLDLPSGTYVLEAVGLVGVTEQVAQSTVTVADHDVSGVPLEFAPVAAIPIEITPTTTGSASSQSVAQTVPTPQQLSLSLLPVQAGFDPSGSFGVQPAPLGDRTVIFRALPGRYRLHASAGSAWSIDSATYGGVNLLQQELILGPSAGATPIRITVSQQTASLAGVVTLSSLPSACTVYLIAADPTVAPIRIQRSSTDGTFTFASLPPGNYRAVAFQNRHSADLLDPAILASFGQHVQSITIQAGERSSINLDAVLTRDLLR